MTKVNRPRRHLGGQCARVPAGNPESATFQETLMQATEMNGETSGEADKDGGALELTLDELSYVAGGDGTKPIEHYT